MWTRKVSGEFSPVVPLLLRIAGGGTVVGAHEVVFCHSLINAVPSAVRGLMQVPEVGVGVDIPSEKAVDAGREVVEDEQFLSVYFSVGSDIDVRHIDLFLLGEAVYG